MLGAVDGASAPQYDLTETGGRYKTYAFYAQDDYKVSSRLTLNLGLRENIWGPLNEVNNVMSSFNPTLANPLAGNILGALQFAGNGTDSCDCSTPVKQHNLNPAPRIGAAYRWTTRQLSEPDTASSMRTPAAWEDAPTDARA